MRDFLVSTTTSLKIRKIILCKLEAGSFGIPQLTRHVEAVTRPGERTRHTRTDSDFENYAPTD